MKLSELVYKCIKNVIYYDDYSFTYKEFIKKTFEDSADYSVSINNVYTPLNEAIARLSDLERIPYIVEECLIEKNGIIKLNNLSKVVKEVINIAEVASNGMYQKLSHRPFGLGQVIISNCYDKSNKVYIEYKEDIPYFSEENIPYYDDDNKLIDEFDCEMRNFGITDSVCNYIIEYVSGRLLEPVNAEISNMHITRAEQYFANIRPVEQAFSQKTVVRIYGVGE